MVLDSFLRKTSLRKRAKPLRVLQRYFDSKSEVTKHKVCRVYFEHLFYIRSYQFIPRQRSRFFQIRFYY